MNEIIKKIQSNSDIISYKILKPYDLVKNRFNIILPYCIMNPILDNLNMVQTNKSDLIVCFNGMLTDLLDDNETAIRKIIALRDHGIDDNGRFYENIKEWSKYNRLDKNTEYYHKIYLIHFAKNEKHTHKDQILSEYWQNEKDTWLITLEEFKGSIMDLKEV